jgi:hypothetical protein
MADRTKLSFLRLSTVGTGDMRDCLCIIVQPPIDPALCYGMRVVKKLAKPATANKQNWPISFVANINKVKATICASQWMTDALHL